MATRRVLLLFAVVAALPASDSGRPRLVGDALLQARCEATCLGRGRACVDGCRNSLKSKPGKCSEDISLLEGACIQECSQDTQCAGMKKCCQNSCGYTCQTPAGLKYIQGLPEIPRSIVVRELRKSKPAQLSWTSSGEKVFYVVEESSHAGKRFSPARLGPWATRIRTPKTAIILRDLLPGNWYVYKVASVNANGTRGFSDTSEPFMLSTMPKPPGMPENLRVVNLFPANGTLWGELRWDPPQSDLPIQRYKVYWSRRVYPGPPPSPLYVRHRTVSQDRTSFILKKLEPDSQYFLQVEAYSQFGTERLKGEKGNLAYNTTHYKKGTNMWKAGKLIVKRSWIRLVDKDLMARIGWSGSKASSSSLPQYIVSWTTMSNCPNKTDVEAKTNSPHFELFGLQFGCKYRVNVKEIGLGYSTRTGGLYITTPTGQNV